MLFDLLGKLEPDKIGLSDMLRPHLFLKRFDHFRREALGDLVLDKLRIIIVKFLGICGGHLVHSREPPVPEACLQSGDFLKFPAIAAF